MKRLAKLVVVGLLSVFLPYWAFAAPASASPAESYTVQLNDTLWNLSAAYHGDPLKWTEVLGANPFLKEKGRVINHPDGRVIVLIRPGEQLAGLERIGVQAEMIPFYQLWPAFVPQAPQQQFPAAVTDRAESVIVNIGGVSVAAPVPFYLAPVLGVPLWLLAFLVVLVLGGIYWTCKDIFTRNPATDGPPMVQGGIAASQPTAIEERFDRIAERRYGERSPSADLSVERPQRISDIVRGSLSGNGYVQYRDRVERRRLNREPAYSARFRFPDGSEETLYFLEACANDVVFRGAHYDGFRWEPERVVIPTPAPASAEQPVVHAPVSGRTSLRAVAASTPPVMTTVTVSDICVTIPVSDICVTIPEGSSVQIGRDGKLTVAVAAACDIAIVPVQEAGAAAKTAAS